jgi:hypothetical protein
LTPNSMIEASLERAGARVPKDEPQPLNHARPPTSLRW